MRITIDTDGLDCKINTDNLYFHSSEISYGLQCNCTDESLRYDVIKSACEQIKAAAFKIKQYNEDEK